MSNFPRSDTLLTAEDYLNYDDGTDTRYELYNGQLIEVPPPKIGVGKG